jgi:glycosyltransferase involved in cell wall biosynthesis
MRICHIITGLTTGGAERMLLKLLSRMNRKQFDSVVISLMDKGTIGPLIEALQIPVLTLDLPRGQPSIRGLIRLRKHLREIRPDLLQGWMYHGNLAASWASRLTPGRPPVLWNIRQSLDDWRQEKPLTRWIIRGSALFSSHPNAILYNSITGAEQHEQIGFHHEHRIVIPNGFDCEVFAPSPEERSQWRRDLGFTEQDPLIGLAARYHPMKDHDNFLQAAAILSKQIRNVHFLLSGQGTSPDNRPLVASIEALHLSHRVHLLGERSDMPAFFQSLDIASLASCRAEGFPNVLGEAMACGVPCVATDVGDISTILGDTGIIVPPRHPEDLAAAWQTLLELRIEERRRLGALARSRIQERYALPAIARQYEQLYWKIISE